ncbi:hypothetical protein [Zavarzinia compransoris]|uniref:Uncharacterized protein n=1 Tax=Zavarzinia compransoris TaxID=1264899 RepID=A0A317DU93_9PROT|nr:hypothetical protein [Zavarzinia compransoris]PWR17962.1 hypothetical protein DKG75_20695 [Zavarzinia compransoris]TDP40381.1 hypothetical protein DES42_11519 [Zavarzinia compransoris]
MMNVFDRMRGRGFGSARVTFAAIGAALALFGTALAPARAQAPLAHLGTNAIAVVEDVSGTGGIGFMDFIFAGQSFDLGTDGRLVVSYLSGCRSETIVGGKVSFSPNGATAEGGKVTSTVAANCQVAAAEIGAGATEAGAVVVRGTGDLLGDTEEDRVIRSGSPAFRWLAGGAAEVRIYNAGRAPAELVWSGQGTDGHIEYPASAPRLTPNIPYRVEVRSGGAVIGVARFSIDPTLAVPDTLANRLVPVAKP